MRLSFTPFFGLAIAANLVDASLRGKANPSTDIAARELLDTRIVGGTQAAEGEFPFFVEWDGCGASLIWSDIILSAAHCSDITTNTVLVGAYKDQSTQGGAQFRTITARQVHPDFNSNTLNYDYLVMKINTPVTTAPITLNSDPNYPVSNEVLTVIGFGDTTNDDNSEATTLMQVNVNYIDTTTCSNEVDDNLNPTLELCAGVPGGGKDSCFGDSGGPIFDSNRVQVGIVSYSYGSCAQAGSPGVYSRISGGYTWINEQICAMSSNPPASCSGGSPAQPTPAPVQPTPVPVRPTPAPFPPPISAPIPSPTRAPVFAPVPFPTRAPITSPVRRTPQPTFAAVRTLDPTLSGSVTSTPTPTFSTQPVPTPDRSPFSAPFHHGFKPIPQPTTTPTSRSVHLSTPPPTRQPIIHVPPTAYPIASSGTPTVTHTFHIPPGACFSENNFVEVESKGLIAMKSLKIGDKVKDANGNMVTVYSFGHYQQNTKVEYLQIHAKELRRPLEISKDHLLFVNGAAVPASTVKVGDRIALAQGTGKVDKIHVVTRSTAYAPFTTSGTIMVSGVAASSYVTLQYGSSVLVIAGYETPLSMHGLSHVFQTPHRIMCALNMDACKSETYTSEGISQWVDGVYQFGKRLFQQNGIMMTAILIPALYFGLLVYAFEFAVFNIGFVLLGILVGLVILGLVHTKKTKSKVL